MVLRRQFSLAVRGGGGGGRGLVRNLPSLLALGPHPPPASSSSARLVAAPLRPSSSSAAPGPPQSPSAHAVVSEQSIAQKLASRFPNAARIHVHDVSGGCGSFFQVEVVDTAFSGLNQIKQHQLIHATLASEIPLIHGLQIRTSPPNTLTPQAP